MVEKSTPTPTSSKPTATEAALDLSTVTKTYMRVMTSELQLQLLRKLKSLDLGNAATEEFIENLSELKKSEYCKKKRV